MSSKLWLAAAGSALALTVSMAAQAQPPPAPGSAATAPAAADTPQVTPFGIGFTLPREWTARSGPGWVDLRPPEGDADFVIVDAGEAKDGLEAAATAWTMFRPPGEDS